MEGCILIQGKTDLQQELGEMGQKSKEFQKGLYRWKENRSTNSYKTPIQIQPKLPWRKHWSTGSLLLLLMLTSIHKHFLTAKLKELALRRAQLLATAAFSRVHVTLSASSPQNWTLHVCTNHAFDRCSWQRLYQFKVILIFQFILVLSFLLCYYLFHLLTLEGKNDKEKTKPSSTGNSFWRQH